MKKKTSVTAVLVTVIMAGSVFSLGGVHGSAASTEDQIRTVEDELRHGNWELARRFGEYLDETLAEHSGGTIGDHRSHADCSSSAGKKFSVPGLVRRTLLAREFNSVSNEEYRSGSMSSPAPARVWKHT